MRALVISDTHFGAWTGDDLLSHDYALERLAPQLEGIDELVLLGDLFDFLFSTVERSFAAADGFFDLLAQRLIGRRVVFVAGNHDHHMVVREHEERVRLEIGDGLDPREAARRVREQGYFTRFMARRLPGVETAIAYPSYRVGRAMLCHGHYLDAHMDGSLSSRLLARATWAVTGGRPVQRPTAADYEAAVVPLTELLYAVAQLPHGAAAQRGIQQELERIGRVLAIPRLPIRTLRRLAARVAPDRADAAPPASAVRPAAPSGPTAPALRAYAQVVRNLGWERDADAIVFAHTHQPLAGVSAGDDDGPLRFWNTGSWIYEPALDSARSYEAYLRHGWPGTAVVIDTDRDGPELIELLADHNPLTRFPDARRAYADIARWRGSIPTLRETAPAGS